MTPAAASPTPADAGAPRVEIARLKDGTRTWRIVAQASSRSEAALRLAQNVAMAIDAALAARYDGAQVQS
jgi:hypothetical protein